MWNKCIGQGAEHNDFYCYSRAERTAERDRMKMVLETADALDCDIIRIITGPEANEKKPAGELRSRC